MRLKAVLYTRYGSPKVLYVGQVEKPSPGDHEVLIRVHAASVNPFDWKLRNGILREFISPDFPVTPGRDGCGEITALGKNVRSENTSGLQTGQRVSFISSRIQHGSMAEFVAVKAKDFVAPAPEKMTTQQCAALPLVGLSAWNALVDTAGIEPGMRILVQGGSGGVGSVAIQIARHFDAEVYATCSAANEKIVRGLGATAIPYDSIDFTEAVSECDIVLDTVGGAVHEKSYNVLKAGGCLVYLLAKPFKDLSAEFDVETRQAIVLNRTENLGKVMELAARGVVTPIVSQSPPLADFRRAFQLAESGKAHGKIVLNVVGPQNS